MENKHIHPFEWNVIFKEVLNRLKADVRKYKGLFKMHYNASRKKLLDRII